MGRSVVPAARGLAPGCAGLGAPPAGRAGRPPGRGPWFLRPANRRIEPGRVVVGANHQRRPKGRRPSAAPASSAAPSRAAHRDIRHREFMMSGTSSTCAIVGSRLPRSAARHRHGRHGGHWLASTARWRRPPIPPGSGRPCQPRPGAERCAVSRRRSSATTGPAAPMRRSRRSSWCPFHAAACGVSGAARCRLSRRCAGRAGGEQDAAAVTVSRAADAPGVQTTVTEHLGEGGGHGEIQTAAAVAEKLRSRGRHRRRTGRVRLAGRGRARATPWGARCARRRAPA